MYQALRISPMIPSFDIEKTVSFFKNILDFKIGREEKDYVIVYKDNWTVHILKAGTHIGEMELYLEVDDVDKLWDGIKDNSEGIKIKGPFNREYGMRELHLVIPETKTLMFIGQVLP